MTTAVWLFEPRLHGRKRKATRARNGAPLPGRIPSFRFPHRSASPALCPCGHAASFRGRASSFVRGAWCLEVGGAASSGGAFNGAVGLFFLRSKTPIRPLLPQHRRRVARSGLAMGNLEPDWNFPAPSLALAEKPGYIFVVAKLLPKAPKRSSWCVTAHPELTDLFSTLWKSAESHRRAPTRRVPRWRSSPFNGAKFTPAALVRSALCVTEAHGAEWAGFMQMQVLIPALLARLDVEVTDKQKTLAEHEAKATDAASDASVRQRANDAIVAQTPYLSALENVRLKIGECFQVLLVEPLAKHTHNALDSTLDYAVRDYADKDSTKLRGQVCNGFCAESSLLYIAKLVVLRRGPPLS